MDIQAGKVTGVVVQGSGGEYTISARQGVEAAKAEMEVNYVGLLRLAQEFAPVMRARGDQVLCEGEANLVL